MKAIVVVAGAGTRFLPATKSIPKEMLPLVDKPVIHYLIEEIVSSGIREIVFVISPDKTAIKNYFTPNLKLEKFLFAKRKFEFLKKIEDIHRLAKFHWTYQRQQLGDGHALLCAGEFIKENESVAVLFGDDIVDSKTPALKQMLNVFKIYKKPIIALERVPWEVVSRYGVVKPKKIRNRLYLAQDIIEKPRLVEAPSNLIVVGKYILTPKFFDYLKKTAMSNRGEIGIADTLHDMIKNGEDVYGYQFRGKRLDCGSQIGYLKAQAYFTLKHPRFKKEFRTILRV